MLPFLIPLFVAAGTAPLVRVASTAPPVTCSTNGTPCAQFENQSTGNALRLASTGGTAFSTVSSSGNYVYPALDGEGQNAGTGAGGAFGLNFFLGYSPPTYGVLGYGVLDGLYGATENIGSSPSAAAAGVFGQDDGVTSEPDYNAGVLGASTVGTGVLGESNGSAPASDSQFGMDTIGVWAVAHTSSSQGGTYGLIAESDTTALAAVEPSGKNYVVLARSAIEMLAAANVASAANKYFIVDLNGNGDLTGTFSPKKGVYARTTGASGARRLTYGLRGRSPLIEDVGEAELTNGRAVVALDPALAASLDLRRPYHVLVTPEGESKQLYVAQKGPGGFVVLEADGGRSTITFAYRIVGKPFDDDGTGSAAESTPASPPRRASGGGVRAALSPAARMRQRIGAQRYAQMLRDARRTAGAARFSPPANPATSVTCSSTQACATDVNTSTGSGMSATSAGSIGAVGASGSQYYQAPGVDGESTNVTGNDAAAAFGLDFLTKGSAPTYGALAYGSVNGLYGATENSGGSPGAYAAGVFGQDELASISGTVPVDYNEGVLGSSSVGTGVLAEANGSPAAGIFGENPVGVYAVGDGGGQIFGATGVVAESNDVALEAEIPEPNEYVDLVRKTPAGFDLIHAANLGGFYSFVVTSAGNITSTGTFTTKNGTYARTVGADGAVRISYGSRAASPEIEDVGEAQLTNGRASVALDPAFADSIDMRRPYDVFLTPEGNAKNLYVMQRTPAGFIVAESHGGRSTLAFEYRIIGKPVDDDARRLAAATEPSMPARRARGPRIAGPLSPAARARSMKGSR